MNRIPPEGRVGSPRSAVERRGGSGGHSGGEAKLLERQIILGLRKGGKRLHAGEDGRHTIEARAQATEEVEHEALVGDGGPEGANSVCHRLHLTVVLVHREIAPEQADERRSRGTEYEFGGGRGTEPQGHPRSGEQCRPVRK
jgi:hypothetical protein